MGSSHVSAEGLKRHDKRPLWRPQHRRRSSRPSDYRALPAAAACADAGSASADRLRCDDGHCAPRCPMRRLVCIRTTSVISSNCRPSQRPISTVRRGSPRRDSVDAFRRDRSHVRRLLKQLEQTQFWRWTSLSLGPGSRHNFNGRLAMPHARRLPTPRLDALPSVNTRVLRPMRCAFERKLSVEEIYIGTAASRVRWQRRGPRTLPRLQFAPESSARHKPAYRGSHIQASPARYHSESPPRG
jgi:hypothetical protein